MLQSLSIKNYALIKHLNLEPAETLNIITGETGAGKSILLGALGLLMGKRADSKVLLDKDNKCIIEGTFLVGDYKLGSFFEENSLDYDTETIIRREISPSGKSRAFVNDTPVTLDVLKELSLSLMDIHSQNDTQLLGQSGFQTRLIDAYSGSIDLAADYAQKYNELRKKRQSLEVLNEKKRTLEKESDYKQFVLAELNDANLEAEDIHELEQTNARAEHAEEIKRMLLQANQVLEESEYATLSSLQEAIQALRGIMEYTDELKEAYDRLESAYIEISDVVQLLNRQNEMVDFDPQEAQQVADRLSHLYHLQQKHHVQDMDGLIALKQSLTDEVASSDSMDKEIEKLAAEISAMEKSLHSLADKLSVKRRKFSPKLSEELVQLLGKVGIPDAQVLAELQQTEELTPSGKDKVSILFSANRGIAPQQLAKTASGGEFSRLMFCIKHILADKIALPTIIFDEIDTGVSGEVALKMGDMMKFMSGNHQVISISHLPQIAAKADQHYFVFKETVNDSTSSSIKLLTDDERITHIARMIGGDDPTATAIENARELINYG